MKLTPPTTIEAVRDTIRQMVVGKVVAAHDEKGHHYRFVDTGKVVDSVTTKISTPKPHLLKWYGRMAVEFMEPLWPAVTPENREDLFTQASLAGENVRDNAGTIGSNGHDAIEKWINAWILSGAAPDDIVQFVEGSDPSAIAVARSAQKFFRDHPFYIPIWSELLVGDEKLGIAGTLDVLLWDTWTNQIIIGDWKSSNRVSDDYAIQVSAYRHCFEVMTGLRTSRTCMIFKLSKQYDKYETYLCKAPAKAFAMYKHSAALYDWLMDGKEKLVADKRIIKL